MIHCEKCLTVFTNSVGSGTVLCKECQAKGEKDIFDTQPTCGELSCDECNERYKKAVARIAALEDAVLDIAVAIEHPEYIHTVTGDQYNMMCPSSPIKVNTTASWLVIGGAGFGRSLHKVREKADRLKTAVAKALELLSEGK